MTALDVLVIGAGPAGLSAAIAAARSGASVVAVGSGGDGNRPTETVSEGLLQFLESFGVDARGAVLGPIHRSESDWTGSLVTKFAIFDEFGALAALDRAKLDAALRRAARTAGVRLIDGQVTSAVLDGSRWRVDCTSPAATLSARRVVIAAGRHATPLGSLCGSRLRYDRLICAWTGYDPVTPSTPHLRTTIASNGWWFDGPSDGQRRVRAFYTDGDLWRELTARDPSIRRRVSVAEAGTQRLERVAGERWVAAGDAAQSYDPLSASGLHVSITQGVGAVTALLAGENALQQYARETEGAFDVYLKERARMYSLARPAVLGPFWERRRQTQLTTA